MRADFKSNWFSGFWSGGRGSWWGAAPNLCQFRKAQD